MTQRTKSYKELIIANKDNLRLLQSVEIPLLTARKHCPSRVYSTDHNGGLRSIVSKTISDSGNIKYTVLWENGQQTESRPFQLRRFYDIVEEYELELFEKEDARQKTWSMPGPVYDNDTTDADYASNSVNGSVRNQPKRKTRAKVTNYVFDPLEDVLLQEDTDHRHGNHPTVPIVIPETSPTP